MLIILIVFKALIQGIYVHRIFVDHDLSKATTYLGSAGQSVLLGLQYDDAAALAHDKPSSTVTLVCIRVCKGNL